MQCEFYSVFMRSGSMNDYLGHRQQGGWCSVNQMVNFLSCHHWTGCVMCFLMAHELVFKAMTSWFSEAEYDSMCWKWFQWRPHREPENSHQQPTGGGKSFETVWTGPHIR